MDLLEDEVDEKLKAMKREQPRSIPYAICWMEMHPGYASLRYVSTVTPRHHAIGLSPNGFLWRDNCYPNLDMLLNAFKKNPQGVSKPAAPSTTAVQTADKPAPKNRWGSKPAPPPKAPPPPATQPGWGARPPPPSLPPVPIQAPAVTWDTSMPMWGGQAPSFPPAAPAPNLPPPPTYMAPPNLPPPRPPPPTFNPPPPMLPPQAPPFAGGPPASQGRGRGRTLPAWMSSQSGS